MQPAATALTQYEAICSAARYGQAAQHCAGRAAAAAGAGLTVAPQLACKASSRVGRGRLTAVLQASDQKVLVSEDIVLY